LAISGNFNRHFSEIATVLSGHKNVTVSRTPWPLGPIHQHRARNKEALVKYGYVIPAKAGI
jgi:hypothetical protein